MARFRLGDEAVDAALAGRLAGLRSRPETATAVSGSPGGCLFQAAGHDLAALQHGDGRVVGQRADVGDGSPVDHQQVGELARLDGAQVVRTGPTSAAPLRVAQPITSRGATPASFDVEPQLAAVGAVGEPDGAVVVARATKRTPAASALGIMSYMCSRSARMASAANPRPEPNVLEEDLGEVQARDDGGPGLDQGGDDLVVHVVAVVDDVDAELEGHA